MKDMDEKQAAFFMKQALKEAEIAYAIGEVPVGAVIVADGDILASAHNQCEARQDPTAHAEMLAISKASKKFGLHALAKASIFATLEPCPMCAGAIINAKINKVYFGAFDVQYGCCTSVYRLTEDPVFHHFAPSTGGILQRECKLLIDRHFQRCRS